MVDQRVQELMKELRDLPHGGGFVWEERREVPVPPQIAVQINISPDCSEEQIENLLTSIRRHFYPHIKDAPGEAAE